MDEINVYKKVKNQKPLLPFLLNLFSFKKVEFQPSVVKIEKGLIGEITSIKLELIKKTIQKGVFETISIGVDPYEIKNLSNRAIITNNSGSVTLFDESFNQLKKVDIKGHAGGCAIYNDKNIYISDHYKHCIYLMDTDLNIIKTFGSRGRGMNLFNCPLNIFCQNEYLFVSDFGNERIQILTLDFKYHDTIKLDFYPYSIAVSSTTIGINGPNEKIYFYDLKTKTLIKKYEKKCKSRISFIDSHFYVVTWRPPQKLLIFDEEGELIDEASIESISEHIRDYMDGFMFKINDYLFVTSFSQKKILKFKL